MKDIIINNSVTALIRDLAIDKNLPIAVILTGSFSRNEQSLLYLKNHSYVLGDIEFIVIFPQSKANLLPKIKCRLKEISGKAKKTLYNLGINCEVEYTPACPSYLKNLSNTIFNFELYHHHQVVWGDNSISNIFNQIDPLKVPKIDAFFLICNRVAEQLLLFKKLFHKSDHIDIIDFYNIIKIYIDTMGSVMIFNGNYKPTYRERLTFFIEETKSNNKDIYIHLLKFKDKFVLSYESKLNPTIELFEKYWKIKNFENIDKDVVYNCMKDVARMLIPVWKWESESIIANSNQLKSAKSSLKIYETTPPVINIKMWGKWVKIYCLNISNYTFNFSIRFFSINPQLLCYYEMYQIYASLFSSMNGDKINKSHVTNDMQAIHLGNIDRVTKTWKNYIRTT
ncbi:hypothetical protein [Desulfogranum marinum]|uniref:hypothetical protein n=1 Tax=Desulfogranum marinum TaxID=453220 RepID=UPI0029C6363B|nr:hypothetical protein [Desulfogranum marinum]